MRWAWLTGVCLRAAGMIIKRKSGEIPCPLAVEAFAAHLSYICKYDDKYSKWVKRGPDVHVGPDVPHATPADVVLFMITRTTTIIMSSVYILAKKS